MYSKIICTIFLLFLGYHCVDGASCTTATTCQTTDYTLSTCTNNVCNCLNSSYTAIRTGCALKLDKPVILAEDGRSNQVILGKTLTLTCKLADAETFEWSKDNIAISGETTKTHTVLTVSATDVGTFTCKGKTKDGKLTSELSDAFKVEMLGSGGLASSSIQPTVYVPTTTIVTGASLNLECKNIPMGAVDADISYSVNGATATPTKSVTIDGTNQGKDVTCTIAGGTGYTFSSGTSAVGKLPSLITNIQSVAVTLGDQSITEIGTTSSVTLTCTLTPDADYLGTSPITYVWLKDGAAVSGKTNPTILVTSSDAGTYSCTATLQTAVSSGNKVTVTKRTDGLTISAEKQIKGGRVILTCGDVRNDGVTYQWGKVSASPASIDRQFDRKLQIDNFDTADNEEYQCKIVKNGIEIDKFSKILTTQTTIDKPTITVDGGDSLFGEKGDYLLSCDSNSETIGMIYDWTFKGVLSTTVTGKYYSLPAISSSNNGDYTCKAKFGSYSSVASDAYTVAVTDPGLLCDNDYDCIAAKSVNSGFSGTCDLNDRCKCADSYIQKGDQCSSTSSGVVMVSSLAIMVLSYAITRFF